MMHDRFSRGNVRVTEVGYEHMVTNSVTDYHISAESDHLPHLQLSTSTGTGQDDQENVS